MSRICAAVLLLSFVVPLYAGEPIPKPADAPQPLAPAESARRVKLPPGFRLELIAAEPLVKEPSGVCWDERGRLFVCELHGYNLEGQFDIEALNKTGKLDRVVRRVRAGDAAKEAARAGTFGTVKLLVDTDNDGRIDKARVWADHLPPCYGICPARGGVIVACAPDIIYLADRDGDGKAEIRQTLYTGFGVGPLERGINNPQWGLDGWIYVGRGAGGGTITGPNLPRPVELPRTDFRIRADGTAIEPVVGGTHTFGFTFSESGERYVVSTRTPAIYVAPLPWRYLARNPHFSATGLDVDVSAGSRVYPISRPHPWRTKRAEDPGFSKYYTDHYGAEESTPNGFFTSGCSPLIYQDTALPGLRGHLLACEPAQNLVHREIIDHRGVVPKLRRADGEQESEFLASSDVWFHPMSLAHAPDGSVVIVDFYREIIEDYSAIPRYLQQQYGLVHGQDHGRLWRLTHRNAADAPAADMSGLTAQPLAGQIASGHLWRRQTAQRLIVERKLNDAAPQLQRIVRGDAPPAAVLAALYTLKSLGELTADDVRAALAHDNAGVRVHALRLSEPWLDRDADLLEDVFTMARDDDPKVLLQLALTLGESGSERVPPALAHVAADHADVLWMPAAVLSSVAGRGGAVLHELLRGDDASRVSQTAVRNLLRPLCKSMAARRDADELSAALTAIAGARDRRAQTACLSGLAEGFAGAQPIALSDAGRAALDQLALDESAEVRRLARSLTVAMKVEEPAQRIARLRRASREAGDIQLPSARRLAAVEELAEEDEFVNALVQSYAGNTPRVRTAILAALTSRRRRLGALFDAIEQQRIPGAALSAVQRTMLLEHPDADVRTKAARLLNATDDVPDEVFVQYAAALKEDPDAPAGEQVFRKHCASCHQAHGVGVAVGPDLTAELNRAEETIVRDVLVPSGKIEPNYVTYVIETTAGKVHSGLLAGESPSGVTLRQPEGKQITVLREEMESLKALDVSLMPADLRKTVRPRELANAIAWLRRPPATRILFDDDPGFLAVLNEGEGAAALENEDRDAGFAALRISPPQRYSPRIDGWRFRIRAKPAAGEYRFIRFAWKSAGAHGVMIELANDGRWPPADSPTFRYFAGRNTTGWSATQVAAEAPQDWTVVTRDLWRDFGDATITGIAPTAMGDDALFDRIELLREAPQ